jgi:hypothetical protein
MTKAEVNNSGDKSDNSVNSSDSPKPNPGKDNSSEIKITLNTEDDRKNNSNSNSDANENQSDKKVLVINLKNIKKISLSGNSLVIEFNGGEKAEKTVISEQEVVNNRKLSKVKNYLRDTQRSSVSAEELNGILNTNSNSSNPRKNNYPSKQNSKPLF